MEALLVVLLLSITVVLAAGGPLILAAPGVALAPYLGSHLWIRYAARHLEVERTFPERAFHSDVVTVQLMMQNTGRLPIPWIEVHESAPLDLAGGAAPSAVLALGAGEVYRTSYTICCRRRG